jgi:hypothetical protein
VQNVRSGIIGGRIGRFNPTAEADRPGTKAIIAEAILRTGVRLTIHEAMTEEYILGAATAIEKVARHYAV